MYVIFWERNNAKIRNQIKIFWSEWQISYVKIDNNEE